MAPNKPVAETPCPPCEPPAEAAAAHGAQGAHEHTAHHVSEFGEVENLVHISGPPRPSVDDVLPAPPLNRKDKLAKQERIKRLSQKCFQPRHIHQYWCHETLYRTHGSRSIGSDELFLDLVIVGGLAAIGHELRANYTGWSAVEKFLLLFGAIHNSWKNVVFLWNVWGVNSDLTDKIGIYIIFTSLSFIALGAHGAFGDLRGYVSISSFVASVVPSLTHCIWSRNEPLLHNPDEAVSYLTLAGLVNTIASVPYLVAAFVTTDRMTRNLYWVALVLNLLALHAARILFNVLHLRRKKPITRVAVNIELMVEKYDILTMIVLGESVIGLLFEAARVVLEDGVRLRTLYGSAAGATAMLYSLQTLYINVDSPIAKGGKHAIRYNKLLALLWGQFHFPYHAALVLFATGLGLAIHDIALPPTEGGTAEAADHAVNALAGVLRVEDDVHAGGAYFGTEERWLFSVGWGASILGSGIIGALHYAGPRAATKRYRFLIRTIVVIAVMVGMPFSHLAAHYYLGVHATVLIVIALAEFIFVQMDKMGFFRSEATMFSSSADGIEKMGIDFSDEQDEEDDSDSSPDAQTDDEHVEGVVNTVAAEEGHEDLAQALQNRLCKSHTRRLVATSKSKSMRERAGGGELPHV